MLKPYIKATIARMKRAMMVVVKNIDGQIWSAESSSLPSSDVESDSPISSAFPVSWCSDCESNDKVAVNFFEKRISTTQVSYNKQQKSSLSVALTAAMAEVSWLSTDSCEGISSEWAEHTRREKLQRKQRINWKYTTCHVLRLQIFNF